MIPIVCARKKLLYQTVSNPISIGMSLGRGGAEMLVHGVEACEHRAKVVRPDCDHGREPDGGIHRITSADPVPEAEHVGRVDTEFPDRLRVGRQRYEMTSDTLLSADRVQDPLACGCGVRHRLERREGL